MSERILSQRWTCPRRCSGCEYFSAWEGMCFADDDELPDECVDHSYQGDDIEEDEEVELVQAEAGNKEQEVKDAMRALGDREGD